MEIIFKKIYFIEVLLTYNVVLMSAVQQSDSVIHIYIYIYSFSYCFPLWFIAVMYNPLRCHGL